MRNLEKDPKAIERRKKLSEKREERWLDLEEKGLIGRNIEVIVVDGENFKGRLTFKYNISRQGGNSGYYIGEKQIPLLDIKKTGENYLVI